MERFFYPHTIDFCPDSELALPPEESRHACKVLRLRAGDEVRLFNGDGNEYRCRIVSPSPKKTAVVLLEQIHASVELPVRLTIAAAVPRMKRDVWMVQKLTELGVARLIPLNAERSVVEPGGGRLDKWKGLVIEASKQCGRNRLMEIDNALALSALFEATRHVHCKLVLAPGGEPLKSIMQTAAQQDEIISAVGPEGGWTGEELSDFAKAGWTVARLGKSILRVESAAVAAAAAVRFWYDS